MPATHYLAFTLLHATPTGQKPPAGSQEPVRAPGWLGPSTLPRIRVPRVHLPTMRTVPSAGWPALLATLSSPLTTNLSDLLFGDVPVALQVLARTTGCLAVPTARDAFLTARKSCASITCCRYVRRTAIIAAGVALPRPTEGLTLGLAVSGGDSGS